MEVNVTAEVFKALGDSHRLEALRFLATATRDCCQRPDGVCACDLIDHLGLAQPTVSHHMRVLTQAGLVTATKRGRWTHYTLNVSGLQSVQAFLDVLRTATTAVARHSPSPAVVPSSPSTAQGVVS